MKHSMLRQDVRFALRTFVARSNRTAVGTAIFTLGIAIATCTTIVSLVDAVLLRPLGKGDTDRLINAGLTTRQERAFGASLLADVSLFDTWRTKATVFDGLAAYQGGELTLAGFGKARRIQAVVISSNMIPLLHARPLIGRAFESHENLVGTAPVVLISNAFWKSHMGGDVRVVGRMLTLAGESYQVIGVMPPDFRVPRSVVRLTEGEIWLPLGLYSKVFHTPDSAPRAVTILGRLRGGVTAASAEAELDRIAAEVGENRRRSGREQTSQIVSLRTYLTAEVREPLLLMFGAVCFVVLIACANVANLLLSRAVGRHGEIAVRIALGASRGRLVSQLLTESVLLGLLAAFLGIILAQLGLPLVLQAVGSELPEVGQITIGWRVLAWALGATLVAVGLFAPGPMLLILRAHPSAVLRDGSQRGGARRNVVMDALIVCELALTLILLVGAALFTQSFLQLIGPDRGYDADRIAVATVVLPAEKYDSPEKQLAFSRAILEKASALPGASAAAVATGMPILLGPRSMVDTALAVGNGDKPRINTWAVTASFFHTLGLPVRQGVIRSSAIDAGGIVIDEAARRRLFGDGNPIGRSIHWNEGKSIGSVIAVVGDIEEVKSRGASALKSRVADPHVYVPLTEGISSAQIIFVRSEGDPARLLALIDSVVSVVEPDIPLGVLTTAENLISRRSRGDYVFALILVAFSVVAIVMAAAGIYGTVAYATARRGREMAVRIALGAPTASIFSLVMRRELALSVIGIVVGLIGSVSLLGLIRYRLFETAAVNVPVLSGVAILLLAVSGVAVLVPSHRVTRIDPIIVLRAE